MLLIVLGKRPAFRMRFFHSLWHASKTYKLKPNHGDIDTRTDLRGAEKALREETGCKPTAGLLQLLIGLQDLPKLVRFFGAFQTETTVK